MSCKDCKCNKTENKLIQLVQSDLHRKYKQETGLPVKTYDEYNNEFFTEEYIDWLQEKIIQHYNQEAKDEQIINEFNEKMQQIKIDRMEDKQC